MSRGRKLTDEERIAAVKEYLDGKGSYEGIATKYGITLETLRRKVIYSVVSPLNITPSIYSYMI